MADLTPTLRCNLDRIRERIAAACARAGRSPDDVQLVAVTKAVGPEVIEALAELGVTDIGENRVQNALAKAEQLPASLAVRWHMIGHLQRNKVRHALGLFEWLHAVDSERLAAEIERVAEPDGRVVPVLFEVNVSGEESKFGLQPPQALELAGRVGSMEHISARGLMTMAPFGAPEAEIRAVFAALRELAESIAARRLPGIEMKHLSMGMSQDYEIAVEEGATMVRIGTALFEGIA